MIEASPERYLRSLSDELRAQSQRVRDLIGDAHWLTDGFHKEFLLAEIIRRHLPGSHIAGRGFVVSPSHLEVRSREQDILVVDTSCEAPVFHQGGVIICFPSAVRAAISVKTTLKKAEIVDCCKALDSVRDVALHAGVEPADIWCGAFLYHPNKTVERSPSVVYRYLGEELRAQYSEVDFFARCGGPDIVATEQDLAFRIYRKSSSAKIVGFGCAGLASALFLAHLLDHLATARGMVRSGFADFADLDSVKRLDLLEHVVTLI